MTLEVLPYEIFQLICWSLISKRQDLVECSVVSTTWLPRFMPLLYQDIVILGPPSFQLFYDCLRLTTSTPWTMNRQVWIRSLSIQDGNISQKQLNLLPSMCPKLEQLIIDGRAHWHSTSNTKERLGTENWWPCLKRGSILATNITPILMKHAPKLTHLTLRCMFDVTLTLQVLEALSATPLLLYLSLDEFQCSTNHIDIIHQSCPDLESLRLVHTILLNTQQHHDLYDTKLSSSSSSSSLPSLSLHEFKLQEVSFLDDIDDSTAWLSYIVTKYPHMEKLEWWHKSSHISGFPPHFHISMTNLLVTQCIHLYSVRFFNVVIDSMFYQNLLSRNKLETSNRWLPKSRIVQEIGMNDNLDLHICGQDLISLSVWWNSPHEPLEYVSHLPTQLLDLHLSGRLWYGSFDIHLILDTCLQLESLRLDFGTLEQVTQTTIQRHQHPLKRLFMEEIKLTTFMMDSLSFRCRDLEELDLLDCVLMDDNRQQENDMMDDNYTTYTFGRNHGRLLFPYQRFQQVKLCGFRFSSNPSLRVKSIGVYEIGKERIKKEYWYYLSHHATFLSYTPVHSCRYKFPVHAIKQHCIVKINTNHFGRQIQMTPPIELHALRQMQRHGKFGRDPPCAGYLTISALSIDQLYLENRIV
ncbi:uncharacterized protein BX664DRAFT_357591 [Halteromyces radiatus]|uniref:uncharacterized protein n=1 Tax=Halteromyces radiatus TaxID=101107 RepID=UPI002220242B|nr:uncharacterized protein BX664DRAFT_357591 [Halteromyces radiatus]KAI8093117.1 hypothetical protein BX664DRAFT_357591 [Halteromyces radiatus]